MQDSPTLAAMMLDQLSPNICAKRAANALANGFEHPLQSVRRSST
jgi:hypothetical protein